MDKHKSSNLRRYKDPFVWIPLNIFLRILSRLVNSLGVNKILDVGCGEGLIIEYLISKNKDLSIEGVDISNQAIAMAGQLCPSSSFRQGDICNIDYRDKSFDLILAIEVLEHLVNPEKAIRQAHRISRKYCIFSVPLEPYFSMCNFIRGKNIHRWGSPAEHLWRWSVKQFSVLLHNHFNKVKFQIVFPWIIALCEVDAQ